MIGTMVKDLGVVSNFTSELFFESSPVLRGQ